MKMKAKRHSSKIAMICRTIVCSSIIGGFATGLFSQQEVETAVPKYEIPSLKYPAADAFVITYNIMDFKGADNTGKTDMAPLIRMLLKKLEGSPAAQGGVGNGGVLFLPEGRYLLKSNITVPKGVTIRGEWQKPEKGRPVVGTVIMSDYGRGEETPAKSLFIMEPAAGVKDLAFWYPNQNADHIVPYPPTIGFGAPGYWGNEYCIAQNVTFVNSYSGAVLLGGGGAPNMYGLYGTPLKRGLEIDFIAEVGRVEGVDFSPEYWIGSGFPNAPRKSDSFKNWLKNNGTAVVMRRNDWSYTTDMTIEGYAIGFHALASVKDGTSKPNGQNYLLRFIDCKTALYAEAPQSVGVMFHDVRVENCEYGLFVPKNAGGTLQLSHWNINATRYAVGVDSNSSTHVLINQSTIASGKIEVYGGVLIVLDSEIDNKRPQMKIGSASRVILAGNRFSEKVGIVNHSIYECQFVRQPIEHFKKIPAFPYKKPQTIKQKPDRIALYVATSPEFGVKPNDNDIDNTRSLQNVLDRAKADGGGIVYLPPGKYRVLGHLTIPSGVELKGATDIGSVPLGPGSILEIYEGKGNPDASPFIIMEERSGLRGVVFNYPEQKAEEILRGNGEEAIFNPHAYPYAVRVAGKDAYLVNVGFRATFSGIDLFTHRCDNVYLEYPAGHIFTNGIRVGGGTENARICNAQFNTIGYACGRESKFGLWPNSPQGDNMPAYRQNYRDLRFFVLEDCKNLLLFNNFNYGCNVGTSFGNENSAPSGLALGHGIDAAIKALYFNKVGEEGFDLIGSQIVSLQRKVEGGGPAARYLETAPDFEGTVNLFSSDLWGQPYYATQIGGGIIHYQLARFDHAGSQRLIEADPQGKGKIYIRGSSVKSSGNRPPINEGGEKHLVAEYSIIDKGDMNAEHCDRFDCNLNNNPSMVFKNMIDRDGWQVTTSNGSGANMIDGNRDTRWGTGKGMRQGDWVVIDMKTPREFNAIFLDQGKSAGDFPKKYEVFVSDDGKKWGSPLLIGEGNPDITIIRLPAPQTKRFIKIVVHQPKENENIWWSVAEAYVTSVKEESIEYPDGGKSSR